MRKVFDTFLFYNELELLELRLNTLWEVVDYFVITEAAVTFSGKTKRLTFEDHKDLLRKYASKIIHNTIEHTPSNFDQFIAPNEFYTDRAQSYPHKSGGIPLKELSLDFQREVFQRDSIINGLLGIAKPRDIVIISDLDEIPNPTKVRQVADNHLPGQIYNFCQDWFMYYFNVKADKKWFGTRMCNFGSLKGRSIDLMRYHLEDRTQQPGPIIENGGWHFSFLGGEQRVREKLSAYSYQGRRSKHILRLLDALFPSRIRNKITKNEDIFSTGRRFETVPVDQSFPEYLLLNLAKFEHLIKK